MNQENCLRSKRLVLTHLHLPDHKVQVTELFERLQCLQTESGRSDTSKDRKG